MAPAAVLSHQWASQNSSGHSEVLTRCLLTLLKNSITTEYRNKYHMISYPVTAESSSGLKISYLRLP